MNAMRLYNTGCLPWPHLFAVVVGYIAPPQVIVAGAQPAAVAGEDGNVILDENGNAIGLN